MKPILLAKNTPASPDVEAPIANAISLYFSGLMPQASAATSSSRIAVQARPTREFSSKRNNTTTITIMPRIR